MIRSLSCIVCGNRRLEWSEGGIAPFVAQRCGIDAAARVERVWCPACDLLFFDQRLDQEEVRRLYVGYRDERYIRERSALEPAYGERHAQCVDPDHETQRNRIVALRAEFAAIGRSPGRILDYGGGDGWLTRSAFPGEDVTVFDLADGSAEPVRGSFDLVVCAHVLEHVSFPLPFLRGVAEYLRPGGLLYVEVPGPGRRPPGTSPFDYMGPVMHEHVTFFTGRAMLRLLGRVGLRPLTLVAVPEVTKVLARLEAWPVSVRLPAPVRGPRGTDSLPGA